MEIGKTDRVSATTSLSEPEVSLRKQETYAFQTPSAERFWGAGVKTDKEVKDLFLKFQKAVSENDKETAATLINYPFKVNFPSASPEKSYTFLKNKKAFIKAYDTIFDDKLKKFIAGIDVENKKDIWARYDGIAVGSGVIWIGVYCYDNTCSNHKNYIKIRTIHGNSVFLED